MANTPSLFGDNAPAIPDALMERFNATSKTLMGGSGEFRRISVRGGRFRKVLNGEQIEVSKDNEMNIIVVDAAPVSRTYYEKEWNSDNPPPPTCWSADSKVPSDDVPVEDRQSDKCATCPMNVKGSGQGKSRACRFSQRLAVAIEGDLDTIYGMQVAATSIFGKPENKQMPLQAYTRTLAEYKTPISCVVTEISFDEDAETPKLFWKPVRPLDAEELAKVSELMDAEETARAIEFTVSQQDNAEADDDDGEEEEAPKPKRRAKPKAKVKAKPAPKVEEPEDDEDEEEEEAPPPRKRRAKKAVVEPPEDDDDDDDEGDDKLSGLLSKWDDQGDDDD